MYMNTVNYTLPVLIFKEDNMFVAYTPALDLSIVGNTYDEALKNFHEASSIFFEEVIKKGTSEEVLVEYGWKKTGKTFEPPIQISSEPVRIIVPIRR